jgi:hypothetical protein
MGLLVIIVWVVMFWRPFGFWDNGLGNR